MFAHTVRVFLKPDRTSEFAQVIDDEVIPLLRRQSGFKDEIAFVRPNGTAAIGISLWEDKETADEYQREAYPQVLTALSSVILGTPRVRRFEVTNSTWHKIAAR